VSAGNGDPLAVFGGKITPNAHKLIKRFPLLDNFYDPSRQSADGRQWISRAWRPTPTTSSRQLEPKLSGGNRRALAYQKKGFLVRRPPRVP
jgi:hypothetical protein